MHRQIAVILALVLLLCACAAPASSAPAASDVPPVSGETPPAPQETPSKETVLGLIDGMAPPEPAEDFGGLYAIYYGWDSRILLDGNGAPRGREYEYGTINDVLTGDPAYYTRTRYVDTGERTEWGEAVAITEQALFDLEGNQLLDWSPHYYSTSVGGYVTRLDPSFWEMGGMVENSDAALLDPATGRIVQTGVAQLRRLDDETVIASDAVGNLLGLLDAQGNPIAGFPAPIPMNWPDVAEGFLIGRDPESSWDEKTSLWYVLDRELNTVASVECEYLNTLFMNLRGPYAMASVSDDMTVLYDIEGWKPLLNVAKYEVEYFDGERLIYSDRSAPYGQRQFTLCDAAGNLLAGPFPSRMAPVGGEDSDAPAEAFLTAKDGRLVKLDRDGNEIASCEMANLQDFASYENGPIVCSVEQISEEYPAGNGWRSAMLDGNLNGMVPIGDYMSINPLYIYENNNSIRTPLWSGYRVTTHDRAVIDLLDAQGRVVMSGISNLGTATSEAIAVVRGFAVGLVDYEGNWIAKSSVYDALRTD